MSLNLLGLGCFHPSNEITNSFLEELDIGTSEQWIMERVGIRVRRTSLGLDYIRETHNRDPRAAHEASECTNAELGRHAAQQALERAGLSAADVGLVVGGSCAPDTASPAEACNLAREMGIEAPAFDVVSACTSYFAGIRALSMMRPEALPDVVLLVAMDCMTRTVDYSDRSSAVLWGDGALAAVLSPRLPGCARILDSRLDSSPAGSEKVTVPRLGHFTQEGRTVQMFAIKKSSACLDALRVGFEEPDRDFHFVGHQANLRMLESVCRRCESAPEHHHSNVEWYGNTGAASSGSVLAQRWEKWRPRDDVAVVGVGSGLTWGSYLLRFGDEPTR